MNRLLVVGVWLFVVGASSAEAQTLVLCDAEWMDVERVLALITVEVDEPARYVFRVTDCTEESARVAVSGPEGLSREREVRLATTATEARSRLVALVLVEMVRLGTRERPDPSEAVAEDREPTTDADDREPTTDTDDRAPTTDTDDREPTTDTEDRAPTTDTGEPTTEPESVAPYERFESAEAVDSPPEPQPSVQLASDLHPGERCTIRSSARGCSTALGVGIGVARHHLGNSVSGSLWPLQIRLRYRWRFLYVGARAAGRRHQSSPFTGATVNVSAYTAFVGLELVSSRFAHALVSIGAHAEAGVIRYRELGLTGCSSGVGSPDCGGIQVGARGTFGALLSLRLEIPIRQSAITLEVEGGWMRGVMIASSRQPITGIGGAQLSLLLGTSFGLGGAS
ncbi:MAG: hypothetical protein JJ863_35950 [Deltaproteobacteria bacterium]|nr:hypothetical protein [Deltaproteobacteria bacterium]